MTPPGGDVDVVVHLRARLGEGPRWDHRLGVLAWVDILAGLVHRTDPDTGDTASVPVDGTVGALALHGSDRYLLATGTRFAVLSGDEVRDVATVPGGRDVRMNDGALDPVGRFVAGTMAHDSRPGGGRLYALETDCTIRTVLDSVTISNGIVWSDDGRLMYFVDSATQAIDVFDYDVDTGSVSGRRRWVEIPASEGTPDGITMDAEGCVWVALWGGGRVRRYAPDGRILSEIMLPVPRVSSCAFGGPALDRLFVTSSAEGRPGGESLDGALFVVDPGCQGRPERVGDGACS